ncbi:unnamed protein product [Leuciscus chuanchicus]
MLVQQTGDIHHKLSEKKARPANNLKRGKIAKALKDGPSQYFYSTLQSTPNEQLLAGNMSECLNKKVLKVIGSEMRKKEALHSDVMMEIYLMQTLLKECDTKYFKVPGYIQLFSMKPFIVHTYNELGLSILVLHLRSKSPVSLEELCQKYQNSRSVCCTTHSFFQGTLEMLHLFPSAEDKGLRDFATYAFARLQNASNMTESRVVFRAFCALLTTPHNTNLVKESLCVLESVISRSKEDTLEETSQSEDWEMFESEERRHAMTIIGRSPFTAFFQQIMKEVKEEEEGDETCLAKEDNPYFCPGILTVLFDTYLAIFPLWSGLLLGDLTTSRYESCEQDLRMPVPQKKKRMIHKDEPKGQKRPIPEPIQLPAEKRRIHKDEPKGQKRPIPEPIQLPAEKRRIHTDVSKSQKQSSPEPTQLPAEALPVEEEIDMLWTKPHNELVVAIVKSDAQNLEFLLHHEEFLTLKPHDWLFGETIECYIRAVLNAKGANIYQLSHYTTGVILNGTEDQVMRQGLKKVNFEQYDGVISVVNIRHVHWREYFRKRGNQHGRKDWVDTVWKPGTIAHSFQEDAFSCGVFVMQMAKQVVEHFPKIPESINITPSKEGMCHIRKTVAKTILQASGSM